MRGAIAEGIKLSDVPDLFEKIDAAMDLLTLINQARITAAPNSVLLGSNRSAAFNISVDNLQKVSVMEFVIGISDSRFEITDISTTYSGENSLFTTNLDYYGDGTAAYFSLAQVGGFADIARFEAATVTLTLKSGQLITRADFVLMLYRSTGFRAENRVTFEDLPSSEEYRDAIENAAGCGIVNGIGGGKFDPYGKVTRQDAAVIVYRLLQYLGKAESPSDAPAVTFNDYDMISGYAVEAMNFMINEGMLKGSSGYLRPRDPITRAEAAVFLYRVIEKFELI